MVVLVYDSEDMLSDEDNTCCSCTSCYKSTTTTHTNDSTQCSFPAYTSSSNVNNNRNMQNGYKDIVGNCKEVRIEENDSNLRIVGNNNRIRITLNTGDLVVIGNNTRLKILTNHGHIKYTGNDGRISLGSQSKQQLVEYLGCNGTLKIVNSMKFAKKCTVSRSNTTDSHSTKKSPLVKKTYCELNTDAEKKGEDKRFAGNSERKTNTSACKNCKSKQKSYSYGGNSSYSTGDQSSFQAFNTIFADNLPKSMPNLTSRQYETSRVYCNREPATKNVVQNIGNIVIANASNICIAPFARNVTTKA